MTSLKPTSTSDDGLTVEILGQNGVFYRASVLDATTEEVQLTFVNHGKPNHVTTTTENPWLPLAQVFLPVKSAILPKELIEEVEVLFSPSESEPPGWYPATVKMRRGDFFNVNVKVTETDMRCDILPSDSVRRAPLKHSTVLPTTFKKYTFYKPPNGVELLTERDVQEFQKHTGVGLARLLSEPSKSLLVISISEGAIKRAELLWEIFIKNIIATRAISTRAIPGLEELTKGFTEKFSVPQPLLGLAIGGKGRNIQAARAMPGITMVDLNDTTHTFTIRGETEEVVKAARALLEYRQDQMQVPTNMVRHVIGHKGHFIKEVVELSGIVRVRVIEPDQEPDLTRLAGHTPVVIVGLAESVQNARMLLEFHLSHVQRMSEQRRLLTIAENQLRSQHRSTDVSSAALTGNEQRGSSSSSDSDQGPDSSVAALGNRSFTGQDARAGLGPRGNPGPRSAHQVQLRGGMQRGSSWYGQPPSLQAYHSHDVNSGGGETRTVNGPGTSYASALQRPQNGGAQGSGQRGGGPQGGSRGGPVGTRKPKSAEKGGRRVSDDQKTILDEKDKRRDDQNRGL